MARSISIINSQLGTEPHLVSIICRSVNRKELKVAIKSIAAQSYIKIEVILVDATGGDISGYDSIFPELSIYVVSSGRPLARAKAANMGLSHASGHYLMFLDDDDWIDPDHVSNLVSFLEKQEGVRAVYSSTQKTDNSGKLINEFFNQPFDDVLLKQDNFIPMHAMLFASSLLKDGCHFDEDFDIYEDWDFWLQVSQFTQIKHLDKISAFYRQGGDSQTDEADYKNRYSSAHPLGQARASIYDKWIPSWDGKSLNELIGMLDQTETITGLHGELLDLGKEYSKLEGGLKTRDEHISELEEHSVRMEEHKGRVEEHVAELEEHNTRAEKHVVELEEQNSRVEVHVIELEERNSKLEDHSNKLNQDIGSLNHRIKALNQIEQFLRDRIEQTSAALVETENNLSSTKLHLGNNIIELEQKINEIYQSFAWRAMGPYRRVGNFVKRVFLRSAPPKVNEQNTEEIAEDNTDGNLDLKNEYKLKAEKKLDYFLSQKGSMLFPPATEPKITILLVLYNQAPLTLLCLESILKYAPYPYELVIVDNASSDKTTAMVEKLENVKLIRNEENLGFVNAVNLGAEHSCGEYILLLNNDALLHSGSLESALKTIESSPDIGAVGGKILLLDGAMQEAGSMIFNDGSCLGYGRNENPDNPEFNFKRKVDYCSGAFLLFSAKTFSEFGGFDKEYAPAYYEESDFCIRLHYENRAVIYDPDAVITHFEFASSGGLAGATELQLKHRKILCRKHADYLKKKFPAKPENVLRSRISNSNKNVLLIDDRVPHKNLGSGYPRCNEIAHILSESTINLSFYPLTFPIGDWKETYATLPENVEVLLNKGVAGLAEFLRQRQGFFDYIMVSRIHNMSVLNDIAKASPELFENVKVIYDAEAVTAPRDIMKELLNGESVSEKEQQRRIAEEVGLARIAEKVITVSDAEADIYRQFGYDNTLVIGHKMNVRPTPKKFEERANFLFVGALRDDGSPNVDSLLWFVEEVMPRIEKSLSDVNLIVVGDKSASTLAPIENPKVKFLGKLDEIGHYYDENRVFIAPTRFAAGIPHKVHEAAGMGLPCVVTPLLANQLGWINEQQVLTADTADEFADQCIRLYQDSGLWQELRDCSIKAVREECAVEAFERDLLGAFGIASSV